MKHRRKQSTLRASWQDYSETGWYHLVLCLRWHGHTFGQIRRGKMHLNTHGILVRDLILHLPVRYPQLTLDEFSVMPDHVHLLVYIDRPYATPDRLSPEQFEDWRKERRKMLLPRVVGYLKTNAAKQVNASLGAPGTAFWQERYYDHVIRDREHLRRVRKYIMNNARHHQKQ